MGVPGSANLLLLGGEQGYKIERSLRFNSADSAYLNKAVGTASPTDGTKATVSLWVKRGKLDIDATLLNVGSTSNSTIGNLFYRASTNTLRWYQQGGAQFDAVTTAVYRDCSAWYHIVLVFDTNNATAVNRNLLYINNQLVTLSSGPAGWGTNPSQTASNGVWFTCPSGTAANNNIFIGAQASGSGSGTISGYYFDGLITEVNLVDGQALTPSSFGETDTITGVWKPKKYTGTYGTNGFYLNFSDNSGTTATTLGKDSSGNGNNWTPNNFSVTAGAGNDSLTDTPTPYADGGNGRGNYATLNPLSAFNSPTLSNGNLDFKASGASYQSTTLTSYFPVSGKWYWECNINTVAPSGDNQQFGIGETPANNDYGFVSAFVIYARRVGSNYKYALDAAAPTDTGIASVSGDVVQFAYDSATGKYWWGVNGTWYGSGSPATGANPIYTFSTIVQRTFSVVHYGTTASTSLNCGQRPFAYTPPSGFLALNTQNLPDPTIKKPGTYTDIKLYSGNGTSQTISGLGFSPDLVWIKERTSTSSHWLTDTVRGNNLILSSNSSGAELSGGSQCITAFNSDGFAVGNDGAFNESGQTYVAWCWDKSATPGFDIVTYTGNATARTISHSLGVAPSMMVVKRRDAADDWGVYHTSLGNGSYMYLDGTQASTTAVSMWNNTTPTSSVFSVGTSLVVNANNGTYVAYLWSEVAGFSKFGSYVGNGSSDGSFVYCGFRPRWIMVKRTDTSNNWEVWDTARSTYNVASKYLSPNLSDTEYDFGTTDAVDVNANGFKLRASNAAVNASGGTYIFAAFAESPFKYSLAR